MHDEFQPGFESLEELDGATPPIFPRVLLAGDDEEARLDAVAVAGALAGRTEAVTVPDAADLIAIGSGADALPGHVRLDPAGDALLHRARSPVVLAPRGLADRDNYAVRRIDVGIDGSREAVEALKAAVHLARIHDARLRLIAVAGLDFELGGRPRPADPRELERLARHLEHAADGLPGIWVEADLREGLTDQILIGHSREADLLVLGSRAAYGDRGRVSLGETATRVLRSAACSTLIVPAP
jgi:nucleotide-binding universal stress UspA family protein